MWVKCISRFFWWKEGRYVDPGEVVNLPHNDAARLIAAQCVEPRRSKPSRPAEDKRIQGPEEDK